MTRLTPMGNIPTLKSINPTGKRGKIDRTRIANKRIRKGLVSITHHIYFDSFIIINFIYFYVNALVVQVGVFMGYYVMSVSFFIAFKNF